MFGLTWRAPLVARIKDLELLAETYRDECAMWRDLYRQATTPVPPTITVSGLPPVTDASEPPDDQTLIANAIRSQANGDPQLAAWLRQYAGELRRDGVSNDDIAQMLTQWTSSESPTATFDLAPTYG